MNNVSIIMTHWGMNDFRSETMRESLNSLINTTKNSTCEIIVVDNGANKSDSEYLLDLVHTKQIQFYVRNSENLYFGFGRNVGFDISCGRWVVFTDNDIVYQHGWLELGMEILSEYPDEKLAFTPLKTDRVHRHERYWCGEKIYKDKHYPMNLRAGSNCWLMDRQKFLEVGKFKNHRIAGTLWTDEFTAKGYKMVTVENTDEIYLAKDIGFKKGYNLRANIDICRKFTNGKHLKINEGK